MNDEIVAQKIIQSLDKKAEEIAKELNMRVDVVETILLVGAIKTLQILRKNNFLKDENEASNK